MINVSFGPNVFLSGILLFGVVLLYGLRKVKPEVSRDEDLFFVTTGFFYCGILMVHGWRLDPILLFSQALIIGVLVGTYSSIYVVANMPLGLSITQDDLAIPEPEGLEFDDMP